MNWQKDERWRKSFAAGESARFAIAAAVIGPGLFESVGVGALSETSLKRAVLQAGGIGLKPDGTLRVGLVHYDTGEEGERLIEELGSIL